MFDVVLLAQANGDATSPKVWAYAGFVLIVAAFLALDLGVFHRHAHEVSMKEAGAWSVIWVCTALAFSGFVYFAYERHWLGLGLATPLYNPLTSTDSAAPTIIVGEVAGFEAIKQFVTAYVVEKSLAMDNIFVIAMLFSFFAVPAKYQHRVLFWGILGALAMRAAMIFLGAEMVARHSWVLIIFGGFLVLTALKMMIIKGDSDPARNPIVRIVSKAFPVVPFMDGQRFFTRRTLAPTYSTDARGLPAQDAPPPGTLRLGGPFSGGWAMTPLFLALIMVEVTDLIFAVDSIPAVFAITPDPFIVLTSNIFAILGLRSLYFCLAALITKFRLLKPALILILAFVGVKLLLLSLPPYLDDLGLVQRPLRSIKISTTASLGVVLGVLAAAIGLSAMFPKASRA